MPGLQVTSTAYKEGGTIPARHTCKGPDVAPAITIAGIPPQAKFLAVILDDPDAPGGTWTHWTWWDLPVAQASCSLGEGAKVAALGATEGTTTARSIGYHGPCPPSGTHRYFLHAYATVDRLGLPRGASVEQLRKALQGKVVADGALMGRVAHS